MDDQKPRCPNHPDKESAFYCYRHTTSACLKCVGMHIQCQVENQFLPLEEVFDNLQADVKKEAEVVALKLKNGVSELEENNNKLTAIENLKNQDIQAIEDFFENMKKKAEEMKKKAIENYQTSYTSILEKVSANNKNAMNKFSKEKDYFTKIEKLQENIKHSTTLEEKKASAVQLWEEFERIKSEATDFAKFHTLDHELEFLMSKEEIFSEVGNMTSSYNNVQSKIVSFMEDHMKEYVRDESTTRKGEKASKAANEMETLDQKLSKIDYLKEERQVYDENFLKAMLENDEVEVSSNKKLHQLRYCSNEVNIFDCATGKFSCYELYTTSTYKTPFFIFNNCCSAMYKNHLIFLFGGEDPVCNDKTSNRVFCFNLDQASISRKVVVYEINPMATHRQEFTLATIGNSIYIISGYDSNKVKEYRVIPKCERLDIKSKKFCDMRDINYPRQAACSVNVNNTHIYVFAGQNPKYLNHFVDKIERYTLNLDDWSVLKYSVMNEFNYEPGINATAFRVGEGEIAILGGMREFEVLNGYYVFDMRKLLFVKKEEHFLKESDNFFNQNDVEAAGDGAVKLFSSNMANFVYSIKMKDAASYSLSVEVTEDENAGDYK